MTERVRTEADATIPKTFLGKHNRKDGADDTTTTKTFTLTETVPAGYEEVAPWTVTVKANGTSVEEVDDVTVTTYKWVLAGIEGLTVDATTAVYEITNTKKVGDDSETVEIKLHKKTDSEEDLSGVTFTLTDSEDAAVASGVTGTDGTLTLTIPKTSLGNHNGKSDKGDNDNDEDVHAYRDSACRIRGGRSVDSNGEGKRY